MKKNLTKQLKKSLELKKYLKENSIVTVVRLYFYNYAKKADLRNAAGVDTPRFARKVDLPYRTKQCRTKFSSPLENFITFVRRKFLSDEKFCPLIFLISFKHQLVIIYSVKINVINKTLYPEQIYFPISYQI